VDFYGLVFDATAPAVILGFLVSALVWGLMAGGVAVVIASVSTRRAG
jgi:hypothetical protein